MLKRSCSILTMILALAIMLGHNIFPHHHHEVDKELAEHHHSDDHNHDTDHESPIEAQDLEHLFSVFQHPGNGVSFLTGYELTEIEAGKTISAAKAISGTFYPSLYPSLIRQKSPPFRPVFRNFQYFLPTGLRAPPLHIV